MAQLVGHNDCFQLMKLSQICLFRLSKDETLAANIAEIANNGLPGHLLDDLAKLLSANGLCLFESHGILNDNDSDMHWHALCDHNCIKKWDETYELIAVTTSEDRQRRSWKEFYFQWQFYELFRNSLDIDTSHLTKTRFFLFETPKLNESEAETWHIRFASLCEETLDFICFYPRMLKFRKEIIEENSWILNRITKNVKEVQFHSFLRFKPSHLEVIHDVFAFCDFSRMTAISFRNTKILEKDMSKFKAIMEELCKRGMTNGQAVASKAVYLENGSSCQRFQDVKEEERSFKHAFEYLSNRHETVDCTVVTGKCESISDRIYESNDGVQADGQSKTRTAKQGDVTSESEDFQAHVQSKMRMTTQGNVASEKRSLQFDVQNAKTNSRQGSSSPTNWDLYFPFKKRKFLKEETVPIAACNTADSEDRMRTSRVFMPEESGFVDALEDMKEDLHDENNERYFGSRDVTFDDALCGDVLESYELDKVVDGSTNFIDDGRLNVQFNVQSSGHTPNSSINCDSLNSCSSLETSRLTKLKFVDCVLNSSSISILCDIIEKLPNLRTFYFCSNDLVEHFNVDKIVSSILQTSRKDEGIFQKRVCATEKIELCNCIMGCYSTDYLLWHQMGDCDFLSGSKLPKLKSLTLRNCNIFNPFEVSCNCEQRHKDQEKAVVGPPLGIGGVEVPCQFHDNQPMYLNDDLICTCNWSSLTYLDLSSNDFWCKGAYLLSCVLKTVPIIKVVRLVSCAMPTSGCKAIFDMAKDHPSLECLDVSINDYNVSEDGSLARLISDGRLTHLFLRMCISPDSYTEEFFESFSRNATLKCLDLSQNRSGTEQMKWFTNVLSKPETLKSLEELDLRYNRMPVSSLRDLADAMVTSNRKLRKLNVSGCLKLKGEGLPAGLLKVIRERVEVFNYMPDIDSRVTDFFDYVSVM